MSKIAVIGLGNMGFGMAARLHGAGFSPVGFDLAPAAMARAVAAGIATAPDLAGAVTGGDVVVLSLPTPAATRAACAVVAAGAVVVDTSTLGVEDVRAIAADVATRGAIYLDAPVSGGAAGAAAGTLTMMVGGDADALERIRPVLAPIASRIVRVGASGAGQVAKLANNILIATHMIAAAEAVRMAEAAGVPAETVIGIVNTATGRSFVTEVSFPRWILSGTFDSGFAAGLMRKDVGLAMDLAKSTGVAAPVLARAAETWLARSDAVPGSADCSAVSGWIMQGGDG